MSNKISLKIAAWQAQNPDGPLYNDIDAFIRFRAKESFKDYHPTDGAFPNFEKRLEQWLDNLGDPDDQRKLFEIVPKIHFIGEAEIKSLCRTAYRANIVSWLINLYDIGLTSPSINEDLTAATQRTWFCSATDSMGIAEFCHINSLHGQKSRPTWRDLAKFGDVTAIKKHIDDEQIDQIVILEDFVGSGSQFLGKDESLNNDKTILKCIANVSKDLKVIIIPLICCQNGESNINKEIASLKLTHTTCSPVLLLPNSCFIRRTLPIETSMHREYEDINDYLEAHALISKIDELYPFRYTAFGYKETGSLVVLHTNCSDNTLSIIHEATPMWTPLFPRTSRV